MAKAPPWEPPPDPDFRQLATDGYKMWQADQPKVVSFDTETTGLAYYDAAFCVTAAWDRPDGSVVGHYFELDKFDSSKGILKMLDHSEVLIGHNLKFDLQKTALAGLLDADRLTPEHIEDTQILATLVNEHRPLGLKDLMVSVLNWGDTMEVEIKSGHNKGTMKTVVREKYLIQEARRKLKLTRADGYDLIPRGIIVPYAVTDAVGTHKLWHALAPLVARYPELTELYRQEMELTLVLLDMEDAGLGVRIKYVDDKVREYNKKLIAHDTRIQEIVGKPVGKDVKSGEFNPGSDDQVKELFTSLGYPRESYDAENMAQIPHPLAKAILARRDDQKLLSTYLRAIQSEQRDGILHPSFRQNVSTGRMASGRQKED